MSESGRIRTRKALGQHWLRDSKALKRIAAAADFNVDDTVIEVGAGTGLLTDVLARRAGKLIAVEVDEQLALGLRWRFEGKGNVSILQADVMTSPVQDLLVRGQGHLPYVVVGNLPYFIGTAIVRRFLYAAMQPRWILATLQAEVAESMTARPGRMSALSVQVQMLAAAKTLFYLPPTAFSPPPKVRSAVVRLDVLGAPEVEVDDREAFLSLVHAGFAAPRKHLRNSLAIGLRIGANEAEEVLADAGLDSEQRPAELPLASWRELYFAYRRLRQDG